MEMKKFLAILMTMIVLVSSLMLSCFAAGGNGSGGGNGGGNGGGTGGGNKPVAVESAKLQDDGTILVKFSKNVNDAANQEENRKLFVIQDKDGNKVDFEVVFTDTQVNPDMKDYVVVKPAADLKSGNYTLIIKKGVTAHNGNATTEKYEYEFEIKTPAAAATTKAPEEQTTKAPEKTENLAETDSPAQPPVSKTATTITIIVVIVVIGGFYLIAYLRKQKKMAPVDSDAKKAEKEAKDAENKESTKEDK